MVSIQREATTKDDEIQLSELLWALWHYKLLIIAVIGLCGSIAMYMAITATPMYRAEAIVTEVSDASMGGVGGLIPQLGGLASLAGVNLGGGSSQTREAKAILASRRLVEEFVQRNTLLSELFPETAEPPTLWLAVRYFRAAVLNIREDELDGLTTVTIKWKDPVLAAKWANEFVALANEMLRTRAINESSRNIAYLKDQVSKTNVVELQNVLYKLIETETKTQMLASGKPEYAFTVIDPAVVPEVRVSPQRTLMVLTGLVIGGVLGGIIALMHRAFRLRRRPAGDAG